ncbi:Adenosylmethionine-8-amino-7-oxononanoate aminotransferase [Alteribacillus persepolensis]|uniref:Adenosylmethionine-8-amino-7-oxononanoate aminotransferase n=1 Tax=Alteribacillus persepolensis TaxID=568899 RepID=A0A1G8AWB4_9BACI|nr:Adenosylmethionine-8-amino-7-oxononanoate aminotransferase [Alteribacillus persepolensis]
MKQKKSWYEKDKAYVWHHMKPYQKDGHAMVVKEAQGAWITDIEDNKYLDAMSGLWCVNAGYGRKELVEAASQQLAAMPFYPLTNSHTPAIELAEKLREWLAGSYRIVYANSGSEANETAFKIARQFHRQHGNPHKYKIISRYRSYHGSTLATLAATGQAQRKYLYEPLPEGFIHVRAPDSYRKPEGFDDKAWNLACAQVMEDAILFERPETVAAVIMEPIITGGGILIPHESYVKQVEKVCRKHDVLLIIDEVICGFGRTGKKFGFLHYGIKPDIVTMAKGITSGYLPLAATAVREELYESFQQTGENDHFRHVNTFGGNPAACKLAVRNLELMEQENLCQRAEEKGAAIKKALMKLFDHPHVGDVRQKGLLIGIELVKDKDTKEPVDDSYSTEVVQACKKHGLIAGKNADTVSGYSNIINIAPPLSLTDDDAAFISTVMKNVFFTEKLG